ncbi:ATP synthase subunit B [Metamycoplasma hyosynoviae]|uniref:ATP synthase subunit b n=1 Tax=Metamycoplasma hyosynoviae TaxID=29559 RepID=A0A063YFF8_9BACT|nr:ATP synthase F0 subunit B [Metamycoplasma hyosynoviae]ASI53791.1 ATP synthase subunit B [Metamycoplasma hyosynoviae]KDE41535.1 ATP synthase subunit B [Metamycoplasma hyosynoviae]KDE42982.1 ATP synthase subunit B [Metamycoplasma hyosynoviae]KDE43573.1 ATP synthase subunit B [Metamycoplasma hyosynoviae]KDE44331.1 ATP synthase subunit B [Metamycoplasma hyosynoviae]
MQTQPSTISEQINNIFSGLKLNWPYFVFALLTLGLLTLFITFLVYKPIKKMLQKRHDLIQSNIDESIAAKENASKVREEIDQKLINANEKVASILHNAKSESEKIINESIQQAQKQSEILLEQANLLVEKKYKEFEATQKKIIVENAVELAKQILKREIKDKDNKKMLQEFLEG